MGSLDHEKLDVYHLALDFVVTASDLVENWPHRRAYLADQLNRAATSVVLNTAEGAGEFSPAEKARFYRMARRSATECAGVLDVARVLRLADPARLDAGRALLVRIVSMLVRMIRVVDGSADAGRATEPTTGRKPR